ncbi:MAG: hypothetical protein M1132_01505 [Chloroflexi bacterium]|nr:hypothetical protein [Chloroflexota bacterium]
MRAFYERMRLQQIAWRKHHLTNQEWGKQIGKKYAHILPYEDWKLNLWEGIEGQSITPLSAYLHRHRKRHHSGTHNLLSSWVLCANLYFPFRDAAGRALLAGFLRENVYREIKAVMSVELEFESEDSRLTPPALLGEMDGSQGAGQTSPDVAFEVETDSGQGIVLVECKFTEHSFYPCAGRSSSTRNPVRNDDPERCLYAAAVLAAPEEQCHLLRWGRKYWHHLGPVIDEASFGNLKACAAAFGGYQLFRQQALAEGIARLGNLSLVVSAVAYDARNEELMKSISGSTGLSDIKSDWESLFRGAAKFRTFTHQAWVRWVREADTSGHWGGWAAYVTGRYGF